MITSATFSDWLTTKTWGILAKHPMRKYGRRKKNIEVAKVFCKAIRKGNPIVICIDGIADQEQVLDLMAVLKRVYWVTGKIPDRVSMPDYFTHDGEVFHNNLKNKVIMTFRKA